jgi:hypothetical protein
MLSRLHGAGAAAAKHLIDSKEQKREKAQQQKAQPPTAPSPAKGQRGQQNGSSKKHAQPAKTNGSGGTHVQPAQHNKAHAQPVQQDGSGGTWWRSPDPQAAQHSWNSPMSQRYNGQQQLMAQNSAPYYVPQYQGSGASPQQGAYWGAPYPQQPWQQNGGYRAGGGGYQQLMNNITPGPKRGAGLLVCWHVVDFGHVSLPHYIILQNVYGSRGRLQ